MKTYNERDDWENSLPLSLKQEERKYEPRHSPSPLVFPSAYGKEEIIPIRIKRENKIYVEK